MKRTQIHEAGSPYWGIASANFKEKHQTVEEWVHANVPKSYWENALKWIEKHFIVEPTDNIDWLDKEQMEELKDDIMFFTSENSNRGQEMKWYRLYKESSDSDFTIEDGVLEKYTGNGGKVVIPKGVTSIGGRAFYKCRGLTSVTMPDSVTSIGAYAFSHCDGLKKVTIPGNVKIIHEDAFYYCEGLEQVRLLDGVEEIKDSAFRYCIELTKVTIPDSIKWIGRWAFWESRKLAKVTLPKGVRYGTEAFSNETKVTIKGEKPSKVEKETAFGIHGLTIERKDSYWGNPEYLSFKGGKEFHIRDLAGMISHHTIMRPLNDDWSGKVDYEMLCKAQKSNTKLFKKALMSLLSHKKLDVWWDDTKGKWETDEGVLSRINHERDAWQRDRDMMNGL